jgi:hypothetical protein
MSVDEAWRDRSSGRVDDSSSFTDQRLDLGLNTHCHELAIQNREGLGPRTRLVHRDHVGVQDDKVRAKTHFAAAGAKNTDSENEPN